MKKVLSSIIARTLPLRVANETILALEKRLGIGTGGEASKSGEVVVFKILALCRDGRLTIFDVGSNQGQYTSQAIANLKKVTDYQIHSFEPSPITYQLYLKQHGKNHRIKANNFGLAASPGETPLYMDREGSGLASLTKRQLDHFGIEHGKIREQVKLDTLDNYCSREKIREIDLLKIDVEGHELDVLRGAKQFMGQNKIAFIQFEFGGCNIDTRTYFQDFFYLLSNSGFRLFRILPNKKLYPLNRYNEADEKFRTTNYLAVKKTKELSEICQSFLVN